MESEWHMNIMLYLEHFLKGESNEVRENAAPVTNAGTEQLFSL